MKDFTLVSLNPIHSGNWIFKVSANNYEHGILILASNVLFGYSACKYFSVNNDARKWIATLVAYLQEDIEKELLKLEL